MGLQTTLIQAVNNGKGSLKTIGETFSNFSIKKFSLAETAVTPPGRFEKSFLWTMRNMVGKPLGFGLKTVNWTAGVLAKPIAWVMAAPGAIFKALPTVAPIATVVGAVLAVGSYITNRRTEALKENYTAMQAQAMAQQSASPYVNSVTPEEMAAMNAQMKSSAAGASHAEALATKRAEAAAAQQAAATAQQTTSVA